MHARRGDDPDHSFSARLGTVIITDRRRPTLALLKIEDDYQLAGNLRSLAEAACFFSTPT
jgi:hypothetical protein